MDAKSRYSTFARQGPFSGVTAGSCNTRNTHSVRRQLNIMVWKFVCEVIGRTNVQMKSFHCQSNFIFKLFLIIHTEIFSALVIKLKLNAFARDTGTNSDFFWMCIDESLKWNLIAYSILLWKENAVFGIVICYISIPDPTTYYRTDSEMHLKSPQYNAVPEKSNLIFFAFELDKKTLLSF